MGFSDLTSAAGLTELNTYLSTRSYITGYTPSQADAAVYKAVSSAPDAGKYPHAARWYKHIASHADAFSSLAGDASADASSYGPATSAKADAPAPAEDDDDDEVDLFGSDDEADDAEKEALTKKRLEEYAAKKAGKTKPAAKTMVTLDVKPWDDETDMKELEENVKAIVLDGLVWGGSKLVAVGFGIKKLQINVVVEDDKVSIDDLQAKIEEDEDHVQSTDVAAMQKL
jgi:elongation factor 1-beta